MTGRVLHYLAEFPAQTETFISPLLRGANRYTPEVWATRLGSTEGVPGIEAQGLAPESAFLGRIGDRLGARFRGFELGEEYRFAQNLALAPSDAGPDLIHAHFGPQGFACARAASGAGIPLVCTFYGYDLGLAEDPRWRRRYDTLWGAVSAVLAEGEVMAARLVEMGAPPARVHVQRLPVEVERYGFRRREPPAGPAKLLLVGRMVEKKGIDLAIKAVRELTSVGRKVALTLVGDGPLFEASRELARSLDLDTEIRFLGALSHESTIAQMELADLILQPSRIASNGDTEGGAPYTLLEAQLMGLPVVASDHADIPNAVFPSARFGFPEGDLTSFSRSLIEALDAAPAWAELGGAARDWVRERHAAHVVVAALEARYDQVVLERTNGCIP